MLCKHSLLLSFRFILDQLRSNMMAYISHNTTVKISKIPWVMFSNFGHYRLWQLVLQVLLLLVTIQSALAVLTCQSSTKKSAHTVKIQCQHNSFLGGFFCWTCCKIMLPISVDQGLVQKSRLIYKWPWQVGAGLILAISSTLQQVLANWPHMENAFIKPGLCQRHLSRVCLWLTLNSSEVENVDHRYDFVCLCSLYSYNLWKQGCFSKRL